MAFMVLLPLLLFSSVSHAISIPESETAPDFTLYTSDGRSISLSDYSGTVVILLYWRTDQERSLTALKECQDLFIRYRERGVQVVSITPESEDPAELRTLLRENAIEFPVLIDAERKVFGDYGIRVYPSTLVIDKKSRLAYALPGHSPSYRTNLEAHLQFLLGEIDGKKMQELLTFRKDTIDESLSLAERRYNLALKFTQTQLYDQAIDAVIKSIEAKQDMAKSHMLLGFLYLAVRENELAYEEFRKTILIDPLLRDAKTGLGSALITKGELDQAIEILEEEAESNPCPVRTYYELGRAYELKGDMGTSLEMYRKSLEEIVREHIIPSSISEEYR